MDQRLREIKARRATMYFPSGIATKEWADIDYLLSLLDNPTGLDSRGVAREFIHRNLDAELRFRTNRLLMIDELTVILDSWRTSTQASEAAQVNDSERRLKKDLNESQNHGS